MKPLDPVVEKDLNAIDAALREARVSESDSQRRELQELALLLESDVERPDPAFAAELGERVRAGFPRERRGVAPRLARRLPLRLPRITRLRAASGVAVAAVLAGLVAVSLDSGDGGELTQALSDGPQSGHLALPAPDAGGGAGEAQLDKAPGEVQALGAPRGVWRPGTAPIPSLGRRGNFAPGQRERHIERSASLTLAAPGDELDRVADRIAVVTDRYGGFVLSSQVTSGEDGSGGAFELRIPAGRLQAALRDLAALGEVRSRSQSGQDVTREVVTAADRLQAARAERRSLLRRLENATTDTEAEALRRRLDLNAMEIRSLRSQLRNLGLRTNYAAVSVSLVEDGEGGGAGGGGRIDDALDDALDSLLASLGIALRVLGVATPLGLLAAAAWASARVVRRRRREAALG